MRNKKPKIEKYPDLYENLLVLKDDFGFRLADIGNVYVQFLMRSKNPGALLNRLFLENDVPEHAVREVKKDFQIATRQYLTNIKMKLRLEGEQKKSLLTPMDIDSIYFEYQLSRVPPGIEQVILQLRDKYHNDALPKIGKGVLLGSEDYVDFKRDKLPERALSSPIYYKLFIEYNRILSALQAQNSSRR